MTREFEGKTALVTCAGSGIGAEIARRLAMHAPAWWSATSTKPLPTLWH